MSTNAQTQPALSLKKQLLLLCAAAVLTFACFAVLKLASGKLPPPYEHRPRPAQTTPWLD